MNDDYFTDMIADSAGSQRRSLEKCRQTVADIAHRFDEPVDVYITVTCNGDTAFYTHASSDSDLRFFMEKALETAVAGGVHLIGYYKAQITMGEWTGFTREEHDAAIERYVENRLKTMNDLGEIIDKALGDYDA